MVIMSLLVGLKGVQRVRLGDGQHVPVAQEGETLCEHNSLGGTGYLLAEGCSRCAQTTPAPMIARRDSAQIKQLKTTLAPVAICEAPRHCPEFGPPRPHGLPHLVAMGARRMAVGEQTRGKRRQ
jgi:hypothetical protein